MNGCEWCFFKQNMEFPYEKILNPSIRAIHCKRVGPSKEIEFLTELNFPPGFTKWLTMTEINEITDGSNEIKAFLQKKSARNNVTPRKILNSMQFDNNYAFFVEWNSVDNSKSTWEDESVINSFPELQDEILRIKTTKRSEIDTDYLYRSLCLKRNTNVLVKNSSYKYNFICNLFRKIDLDEHPVIIITTLEFQQKWDSFLQQNNISPVYLPTHLRDDFMDLFIDENKKPLYRVLLCSFPYFVSNSEIANSCDWSVFIFDNVNIRLNMSNLTQLFNTKNPTSIFINPDFSRTDLDASKFFANILSPDRVRITEPVLNNIYCYDEIITSMTYNAYKSAGYIYESTFRCVPKEEQINALKAYYSQYKEQITNPLSLGKVTNHHKEIENILGNFKDSFHENPRYEALINLVKWFIRKQKVCIILSKNAKKVEVALKEAEIPFEGIKNVTDGKPDTGFAILTHTIELNVFANPRYTNLIIFDNGFDTIVDIQTKQNYPQKNFMVYRIIFENTLDDIMISLRDIDFKSKFDLYSLSIRLSNIYLSILGKDHEFSGLPEKHTYKAFMENSTKISIPISRNNSDIPEEAFFVDKLTRQIAFSSEKYNNEENFTLSKHGGYRKTMRASDYFEEYCEKVSLALKEQWKTLPPVFDTLAETDSLPDTSNFKNYITAEQLQSEKKTIDKIPKYNVQYLNVDIINGDKITPRKIIEEEQPKKPPLPPRRATLLSEIISREIPRPPSPPETSEATTAAATKETRPRRAATVRASSAKTTKTKESAKSKETTTKTKEAETKSKETTTKTKTTTVKTRKVNEKVRSYSPQNKLRNWHKEKKESIDSVNDVYIPEGVDEQQYNKVLEFAEKMKPKEPRKNNKNQKWHKEEHCIVVAALMHYGFTNVQQFRVLTNLNEKSDNEIDDYVRCILRASKLLPNKKMSPRFVIPVEDLQCIAFCDDFFHDAKQQIKKVPLEGNEKAYIEYIMKNGFIDCHTEEIAGYKFKKLFDAIQTARKILKMNEKLVIYDDDDEDSESDEDDEVDDFDDSRYKGDSKSKRHDKQLEMNIRSKPKKVEKPETENEKPFKPTPPQLLKKTTTRPARQPKPVTTSSPPPPPEPPASEKTKKQKQSSQKVIARITNSKKQKQIALLERLKQTSGIVQRLFETKQQESLPAKVQPPPPPYRKPPPQEIVVKKGPHKDDIPEEVKFEEPEPSNSDSVFSSSDNDEERPELYSSEEYSSSSGPEPPAPVQTQEKPKPAQTGRGIHVGVKSSVVSKKPATEIRRSAYVVNDDDDDLPPRNNNPYNFAGEDEDGEDDEKEYTPSRSRSSKSDLLDEEDEEEDDDDGAYQDFSDGESEDQRLRHRSNISSHLKRKYNLLSGDQGPKVIKFQSTTLRLPYSPKPRIVITDLGTVVPDNKWASKRYIFPLGYRSEFRYDSYPNIETQTWYVNTIEQGSNGKPLFKTVLKNDPSRCWKGESPSNVWVRIVSDINKVRRSRHMVLRVEAISGPDCFGLSNIQVRNAILSLPDADKITVIDRDLVYKPRSAKLSTSEPITARRTRKPSSASTTTRISSSTKVSSSSSTKMAHSLLSRKTPSKYASKYDEMTPIKKSETTTKSTSKKASTMTPSKRQKSVKHAEKKPREEIRKKHAGKTIGIDAGSIAKSTTTSIQMKPPIEEPRRPIQLSVKEHPAKPAPLTVKRVEPDTEDMIIVSQRSEEPQFVFNFGKILDQVRMARSVISSGLNVECTQDEIEQIFAD